MDEHMEQLSRNLSEDRDAVFQRVWKRVMEGRPESCPIVWGDEGTQGAARALEGPAEPTENQAMDRPEDRAEVRVDVKTENHGGFLGDNCLDCVPMLQEMIRRELADWREYQMLARWVGGPQAKVFQAMANQEKNHAKRLSAAYFLISGVRYWPEGEKAAPPASYLGALRRRFGAEQEAMTAYLTGAEATADPCLRQLFLDNAREEWDHACRIRTLVENA